MTSSTEQANERASDRSIAARETQIGSNLIDRLARLGLHHLDSNIFRQYVGPADAMVHEISMPPKSVLRESGTDSLLRSALRNQRERKAYATF